MPLSSDEIRRLAETLADSLLKIPAEVRADMMEHVAEPDENVEREQIARRFAKEIAAHVPGAGPRVITERLLAAKEEWRPLHSGEVEQVEAHLREEFVALIADWLKGR